MKRICRSCFNFVDKNLSTCPYCHKPVLGKKAKQEVEKNKVKVRTAEEIDAIKEKQTQVASEQCTCGEDCHHNHKTVSYFERPKWIPKKKRKGYAESLAEQNGTHVRVKGVHIDVSTVSFLQGRVGLQNKYKPKQAGEEIDYRQEKLKWWEIYRFADRWLIKRAINKHVKKAAVVRPEKTSLWTLLLLSIFTGFVGGHSFYAKNFKRGIVSLSCFSLSMLMVVLMEYIPFMQNFQYSLCALPGLICLMMWAWDVFLIIIKKYKFRVSKLNYIYSLDVETRARLNNKYINIPNWYEYKD